MASEKAWYWLAAGVLALGLNGAYQDGQFGWAHGIVDRSMSLVERASERGLSFASMAEVMLGRSPETSGWTEAALEKLQARTACSRVEMAQRQIAMAQMQRDLAAAQIDRQLAKVETKMDKVRMITIDRANRARNCSGFSRVVVAMPGVPHVDLSNLPDIQIPNMPEIPQAPSSRANGPI